jgi:prophage antirepressor-like protein
MNQVIPFVFDEYPVRAVVIEESPWWIGKDVCNSLGYKNPRDAMNDHCRGVAKRYPIVDSLGRKQEVRIINEGDVFRLIVSSHLPQAQQFEKWLFEEVLPQIRRTGVYATGTYVDAQTITSINETLAAAKNRLEFLEKDRSHLMERDRLHRKIERLESLLAKKNTPLSDGEKAQIKLLRSNASVPQIARLLNRSPSTIRRVLKGGVA